jgi:hypothetical protein
MNRELQRKPLPTPFALRTTTLNPTRIILPVLRGGNKTARVGRDLRDRRGSFRSGRSPELAPPDVVVVHPHPPFEMGAVVQIMLGGLFHDRKRAFQTGR